MFYKASRLKFDGFCQYYAYDTELIYAPNKDEAIRIYKTLHRVYGRQKVEVTEVPLTEYGQVFIHKDTMYINHTPVLET